ncbi:hypothetical protein [Leucobacter luti]|uniref:hypothetical protein n=1 Tax=Leucobacter luti TaxID=340320 RepID=UPI00102B0319|nr:hypothetical protein [Leucobacter luti]MBL3699986.1 hypothetical protein [Leucobacter luti]
MQDELTWYFRTPIRCMGGCQQDWSLLTDELHLCSYERLGAELHEDILPLCRGCHTDLHLVMERDVRLRLLDLRDASLTALGMIQGQQKRRTRRPGAVPRTGDTRSSH